jgi:lipid II:glycine glycyltransferase (peptidoglycan interpeptide bridge formation enzyme)
LDLTQETNAIFSDFSKQIRQQVKIAENEGIECIFHTEIDTFVDFFNEFAQKKDTFTTSKQRIRDMGETVKLSFAKYQGQILAAHSYIVDNETLIVRHLHSATKRLDENFDRNLIGRANKYLTVSDILYFKENGFKIFDFGGFAKDTESESLKGINNYKLLFGGKLVTCVNYYSYNYWILKKLVKYFGFAGKI